MSLALANYDAPAASNLPARSPAPGGWIDLPTASQRSGRSIGHLQRQCLQKWQQSGLAKQEKIGKTKPVWLVREDADAAFARVKFGRDLGVDVSGLTDAQRRTIEHREKILAAWTRTVQAAVNLNYSRDAGTGQFLQLLELGQIEEFKGQSIRISRQTLYNWENRLKTGGRAGLADGRGNRGQEEKEAKADDPFMAFVRAAYLNPAKLKIAYIHKFATVQADLQGWEIRSYKACQRMIDEIPEPVKIAAREGAKAAKDKVDAFIKRDYSDLASNEIWCGDHHRLDVICSGPDGNGGVRHFRPWLTAWLDVRSRVLVGWSIFDHDPNADVILRVFSKAAIERGVPQCVQIDNGKDYDARSLQGVTKKQRRAGADPNEPAVGGAVDPRILGAFRSLDVEVHHVWKYHGQSKPIERFFGSVADRFARPFATYCGGSTDTRPEDLSKRVAAGRAPTMEEVQSGFRQWLAADYHHRPHLGDAMAGKTPEQVFAECLVTKRTLPDSMIWFACLPRVGPVKFGQAGVTWKGMSWGGFDGDLKSRLFGQKVYLAMDKDDVSRVFLIDLDGRMVGQAKANTLIPFRADDQTLRKAIAEKKRASRAAKAYHENRPRRGMSVQQLVADIATEQELARRDQAAAALPPPSMQPARTPFDADFRDIQRAFESPLKLAGTVESGPPQESFSYGSLAQRNNQDLQDEDAQDFAPSAGSSFRELMDQRQSSTEGEEL